MSNVGTVAVLIVVVFLVSLALSLTPDARKPLFDPDDPDDNFYEDPDE